MKHFLLSFCVLLGAVNAYGKYWPTQDGATASIQLTIVDDSGNVVHDADVVLWFQKTNEEYYPVRGRSDNQGLFYASAKTIGEVGIGIFKEGYYTTEQRLDFKKISYDEAKKTRSWTQGIFKQTILLRRKQKPITLIKDEYDYLTKDFYYPITNQVMGFDLKLNDWCAPYGRGEYDDLQMRFEIWRSPTNAWFEYHSKLEITMTNSLDGFYMSAPKTFSSFPLEYNANLNATYKREIVLEYNRTRKKILKVENPFLDSFMVFRTRTKVDDKGNLISAHYGFIKDGVRFTHWLNYKAAFNPNENDTNLEDAEYWRREELTQQKYLQHMKK